ncbi:MAG TPA: DNA polymerase I [Polyangiaceae bacterium]|nr:DNA polymerase I [Polyangiaceae bacterium]
MATRLFDPGADDVLYLVDLSGYVFRAYHALAPLTNAAGEPTHAVYGTITMLERMLRQRRPRRLAVAMDAPCPSFRKAVYDAYKANRATPPADLVVQFPRVSAVIDALAIPILQQDGLEADDLIATAVRRARERQLRAVIVSADKDLMQLVGDDVLLWDTMRDRVVGPAEVVERFGVEVAQLGDLLALMGDASDNVPGVPSVGPKTARDLLLEHGTLDRLYAALDRIPRAKLRETLAQHRAQAYLSRELVTLRTDARIDPDLDRLRPGPPDRVRLRALYAELGFSRLLTALDEAEAPIPPERAPSEGEAAGPARAASDAGASGATEVIVVDDPASLDALVARALAAPRLALTVEPVREERLGAALAGLGIAFAPGRGYFVPFGRGTPGATGHAPAPGVRAALARLLEAPGPARVLHDAKRTEVHLKALGLGLGPPRHDTLLMSYLLDPEAPHGLEALCDRELGVAPATRAEVARAARGKRVDLDGVPVPALARLVGGRAPLLLDLAERLAPRLAEERLTELYERVELPLARILARMELDGVLVDRDRLRGLAQHIDAELARLEQEAHRVAGRDFNVHSPRQLERILFDELALKPVKRTKTSRSTDAETLEALLHQHELPRVVLELRQLQKLKGTYVDTLPTLVSPLTGRIHTCWEQAVTATGRLSSSDPNLQNIPVRTELGRQIRAAFVAPPGQTLVSADYSQIELRVLAHLSSDPVLTDAFRRDQDIHTRTAMEVFDVDEAGVTPELRRRAKAVNFGVIYGQGDLGLAKSLGISRAEASSFIAAYYRRYPGVRRFMDQTLESARAGEAVRSMLGRRRRVPDIGSANRALRLAAERIAMNMPIQGSAADLFKLAMIAFDTPPTPGARMVLTVHDELVFEVPEAEAEAARAAIRRTMEAVVDLAVPLVVDVGVGPDWNAAH